MYRRRRLIAVVLAALCVLAAAGYVVYSKTVKDYVDCARMLSRIYEAKQSDLTFNVTIDASGQSIDTQFRAVRFPYQNVTAVQVTLFGKNQDYTFYKINGRNLADGDAEDAQNGIPRNFMELIQWGKQIYDSDLEIRKIKDRGLTTFTVDVPDEMVQSFMDAYLGRLETLELKYTGCKLILTGSGRTMTELALQGTADYRILFTNHSANILVRAKVNAVGNQVQIPDVPDYVVKAAN